MNKKGLLSRMYITPIGWSNYLKVRKFPKILFNNRASKIILLLLFGSLFFNQIYTRSQVFMPKEYKLIKKNIQYHITQ